MLSPVDIIASAGIPEVSEGVKDPAFMGGSRSAASTAVGAEADSRAGSNAVAEAEGEGEGEGVETEGLEAAEEAVGGEGAGAAGDSEGEPQVDGEEPAEGDDGESRVHDEYLPPRGGGSRFAQGEESANRKRPVNKKLKIALSVVAAIVLLVGSFVFVRWYLHDDATLIQGEWKVEAADRTMVITEHRLRVTTDVAYQYELDAGNKVISFEYPGIADGAASYYFSLDGRTLVITEGEAPNILIQIGLLPNPAIAADSNDDKVIVLTKISDNIKAKPGKIKGSSKSGSSSSSKSNSSSSSNSSASSSSSSSSSKSAKSSTSSTSSKTAADGDGKTVDEGDGKTDA